MRTWQSVDVYPIVDSLPAALRQPPEGKNHLPAEPQSCCIEVDKVDAKTAVLCWRVIDRVPTIGAPMDYGGSEEFDAQYAARRHATALVIEAPGHAA